MGIKDINKTLKEHCPDAFFEFALNKMSGYALGIDANGWAYKTKSSAMKDVLRITKDPLQALDEEKLIESMISMFYKFIYKLCENGITPVWIFDGEKHPDKIAVERRHKSKSTIKLQMEEERAKLEAMDPLERIGQLDNFIKKMLGCFFPTKEEMSAIKSEIENLGIPMFIAPYDAEIMAAKMSREKLLFGVWSIDTDTYPSGSTVTVTGFSKKSFSDGIHVEGVLNPIIWDTFGITREEFVDFCIMHGCDFNDRIKGIGPSKIYSMMEKYGWNIDKLKDVKPELEWDILNHESCRKIFEGPDISNITMKDLCIDKIKWSKHMRTKQFSIELPPNPKDTDSI